MGKLTMTELEYQYYVDNLREAFDLIGQKAYLFQVDKEFKDLYQDKVQEYHDAKEIAIIFEDNPRPILKKYNWLTETEDMPYIAYVVPKASDNEPLRLRDGMKIGIVSEFGLKTIRMFKVSKVNASSIDPLCYICKLVPYRYKEDIDREKPGYQAVRDENKNDTDFSYIKTDL